MIKGINTGGRYITVTGGAPGSTYVNNYSGGQGVGNMRYNTSTQNMEVFDGNQWHRFGGSYASVSLNSAAIEALDWCQRKMTEEAKIKELCEKSPTVADAFATYNDAKSKLEVVLTLADQAK